MTLMGHNISKSRLSYSTIDTDGESINRKGNMFLFNTGKKEKNTLFFWVYSVTINGKTVCSLQVLSIIYFSQAPALFSFKILRYLRKNFIKKNSDIVAVLIN